MIIVDLKDIIGLCVLAAVILFWIGFILYANISAWIDRKIAEKKYKKSITVEPPEVKMYKYICASCPDKCVLFSVEKGKVPTSCPRSENEHKLTFWEQTEQVFEIKFDGKIIKF